MEAGWLVCPIIKIIIDKAKCCAFDRIRWLSSSSIRDALDQVKESLVQLHAVAGAVEKRTSTGTSAETSADLRAWLQQLKDAVYEADDVLDDFDNSALQPGSYVATVTRRIIGTDEALNKLKNIIKKLNAIHASSERLVQVVQLHASSQGDVSGHHRPLGRATGSIGPPEQPVFGRDKEMRHMVSWLVGPSNGEAGSGSVPIAAIMGHGGMGKTTLAQRLFQDPMVVSTFDLKLWVQPNATDDELELVTQILQSADVLDVPDRTKNFDWLQKRLRKAVSSRRFLLVIDDVWNREDMKDHLYRDMWTKVLAPLTLSSDGKPMAMGSKIVVTSRQKIVAKLLGASKEVWLDGLQNDDIWLLLKRSAFGEDDMDKHPAQLQTIGRQIADKLRGSPLVAMAVGQMLKHSRSITQWRKVLDMNIYDNVSSTLELCYHRLPEHLQPCFAICSIFPKNWTLKRDRLVKIWMAVDFIQLEEEGSRYFDQLVARSFFHKQKVGRRNRRYYYVHDLMHDLAEKVSWFDCIRVEGVKKQISKTVRHISVSSDAIEMLPNQCELKRLRTLIILNNPSSPLSQLPDGLLSELKGLRVLCLEGCSIVDLSDSIGHLKHLRYLALCKSITRLPRTVTTLYHLQTLRSPKRSCLKEIPKEITNLKCLRHLDMDTSKIIGIGKLVHLQGSVEFHVKNEKGHTLEDLNGMSCLRKELHIKNLEAVTSQQDACQAGLNKKENLRMLELEWNLTDSSVASVAADVLDGLEPHQHIKKLYIRRYPGKRSPNWLNIRLEGSEFFLRYLYLINCRKWEVLPPLGQLPCLKVLHMKEMCSVTQINQQFYGTNSPAFPCLEELQFEDMPNWVEWTQEDMNVKVLPKLCKLKLSDCPALIKVPLLPLSKHIRTVSVKNSGFASQLQLSLASSSKSNRFALDTCSITVLTNGFLHQQQVEAIALLTLRKCQDAKFENIQALTSLKKLQIHDSNINDEQLGTCLQGLLALTSLEIVNCSNITSLPKIQNPDCLTKICDLHIQHCSEFSSLHALPSFVTLEKFLIDDCPHVTAESFPATLNSNSSLRELKIMNCVQLESLPTGFPSSMQVLYLIGCKPTLMNQLQDKDGPEWDKLALIPMKQIH